MWRADPCPNINDMGRRPTYPNYRRSGPASYTRPGQDLRGVLLGPIVHARRDALITHTALVDPASDSLPTLTLKRLTFPIPETLDASLAHALRCRICRLLLGFEGLPETRIVR